jgi:hypothetical protein
MPTRYYIGGAAIAAATYYLYQQRLEKAQIKQQSHSNLASFGSGKSTGEGPGEQTGRKLDEAAAQARDKFKEVRDETGRKIDTGIGRIEQERAKATNWAGEKLSEESDRAKSNAEHLNKQAKGENTRGTLDQVGHDIKRSVYDAKDATEEKLSHVKNKIIGEKDKAVVEANEKKSWFTSGPSDDAIARNTKRSLAGWSETAQQNADAYYDSLTTKADDAKSSLFSWGSSKKSNAEESLNKARNEAQKLVDDAQKKYNETRASWFSFNQDAEKKRLHEEASKALESAQSNLNSATDQLNEWKNQAKNKLKNQTTEGGFYSWLRGDAIPPEKESALARTTTRSLRGWGESAEIFARDELDESQRRLGVSSRGKVNTKQLGDDVQLGDKVQKRLDSWSKWANKSYESNAQGAQEFYNDSQQALQDAKKEVENSTKSWFSWGSNKSKDLELEAKRNLEDAQERLDRASRDLQKWGTDTVKDINLKFWSSADDAVHQTKKGLNSVSDQTKDNLNEAQKWVKED